jgi:NitT/TauT family transport system substrate-binding protein
MKQYALRRTISSAIFALFIAGAPIVASAQNLEKVTLGWPANFSANFGHFTFGMALGFFKEEGIDLHVVALPGSNAVVQQVLSGNILSGYIGVETVPLALQPGATKVPLIFVYNYMRKSIWEMAVPANSPIKTFADLKGKTIGTFNASSGNVIVTKAALGVSGVKESEVKFLPVGFGAPALIAIRSGQIDASNLLDTVHATFEANNFPVRRLEFPPQFEDNPSHGYPVSLDDLKNKRGTIVKVFRALSKSIIACEANLDACIRSFWTAHPALKPTTGTEEENMKRELTIQSARMKKLLYFRAGQEKQMGAYSDEDWKGVIEALSVGGAITKTDLPMNQLYTNELVKEINAFDVDKVVKIARAAK